MIFLALYSHAHNSSSVREKAQRKTAPLFSKHSQTSAFVVWREDRETFPENDAFRMKDTHTTTTTTPNRFRIKSQRGKMFDEFFPQTKKQSHTLSSRA